VLKFLTDAEVGSGKESTEHKDKGKGCFVGVYSAFNP
jgi:hypothetical protein